MIHFIIHCIVLSFKEHKTQHTQQQKLLLPQKQTHSQKTGDRPQQITFLWLHVD